MKPYRRSVVPPHRPSSTAPPTPRRLAVLALGVAAALALAAPARGAITGLAVRPVPLAPTWADEVVVQLSGESECLVSVGSVDVHVPVDFPSQLTTILVELTETCSFVPPQVRPFDLRAELPHLDPGDYVLRVFTNDDDVLAESLLTVYDRAQLLVDPGEPVTDAEPLAFTVTGYSAGCIAAEPAEVDGAAIRALYPDECPILPPGPFVTTFAYEVGPLPAGDYEIQAFRGFGDGLSVSTRPLHVYSADGCVPSDTALCLQDDRFRVEVSWKDFQGGQGDGRALPLPDRDDTGLFWFFNPANVELTVKVLDGCPVNGHFWVFAASGSTVEYEITVTDTQEDVTRTYGNDLGDTPSLIPDTGAFATCP